MLNVFIHYYRQRQTKINRNDKNSFIGVIGIIFSYFLLRIFYNHKIQSRRFRDGFDFYMTGRNQKSFILQKFFVTP